MALMVMDHYSHLLSNFRNLLLTTIEPIERTATLPLDIYNWMQKDYTTINQLRLQNQQLQTENLLLKAQQQQMAKLKLEIDRLNRLLGTASQLDASKIQIATVTAYSQTPYAQFYTLNKGALDEVDINQTVIDAKGLIGLITHLTPTSSRAQLITDPDIQVPVRIQRTGQRGILSGLGHDRLSLMFIPNSSSVQKGDLLETSGLGNIFPEGYPVAKISKVSDLKDQPYYEIAAEPMADLNRSQKVLILSNQIGEIDVR
ncbi:rod shape-determining protein MreC [Thiomicrospira sp. XS5]|uniref:rod shape-determining protein MreC n=1 Tax=Thiomicrospira sp. XS5 TaxID=1775636 RepID=UPI002100D68F|nr:rod shape-determining protein MreC [Thiomicrospira sp. XS5]